MEQSNGSSLKKLGDESVSMYAIFMLIVLLVASCTYSWVSSAPVASISQSVLFTFYLNGVLGVLFLFSSIRQFSFSLAQFHWVFYLVFFYLAPLQQYCAGYWPWQLLAGDSEIVETNIVLSLWAILFYVGTQVNITVRRKKISAGGFKPFRSEIVLSEIKVILLLGVSATCVLALIADLGISAMLFRSESGLDVSTTSGLLSSVIFRATPLFCLVFILIDSSCGKKKWWAILPAFALLLLACFPLGVARFMVAGVYLGLLLFYLQRKTCPKGLVALVLLIGISIVFSYINVFRTHDAVDAVLLLLSDPMMPLSNGFLSGNFDAYSMIIQVEHYVDLFGNTNGKQLLGALFFFVPRAIWPDKAVITGPFVFEAFNRPFTNVGTSVPAEAFIDFGFFGVLLCALILGGICGWIDRRYWMHCEHSEWTFLRVYYPFLLPLFFFLMRGSLMAGYPYVIGFAAVCGVTYVLICPKSPSLRRKSTSNEKLLSVAGRGEKNG